MIKILMIKILHNLLHKFNTKYSFLSVCFLLFLSQAVHAQIQTTVQATTLLTAPYSPYFSDLYQPNGKKLITNLLFKDFAEPSWDIRLKITIKGDNGVIIESKPNFIPLERITLTPGVLHTVSGDDWAEYLDYNNIQITGFDAKTFSDKGVLPEGFYTFTVEALDYNTGKVLSNASQAAGPFLLGGVPQVIAPKTNFVLAADPQNIIFQWVMTAPPLNPITTEYKLEMYEITTSGVAPDVAFQNGNVIKVFESQPTKQTTFLYDASAPALEVGKRYAYFVTVFDNTGKSVFRNDGKSEPYWFVYGFPIGGKISLTKPEKDYQFTRSDRQKFQWSVPDNKAISSQLVSYHFKVVQLKSDDEDLDIAIKNNKVIYEENTEPSSSPTGWTTVVEDKFESQKFFAWKVEAYSGDQKIAESEIRKFQGAPLLDYFRAGDHDVTIVSTTGNDITNLTGTGIVKLDSKGIRTAEIDFKNIKLKKAGSLYLLEEGTLFKELKDQEPIEIPAKNKDLRNVKYIPTAVKLDNQALSLRGDFSIPLDIVLDGSEPNALIKDKWMNYNSFYLRGGVSLNGTFDIMEPLNFQLNIDTASTLIIGATGYQIFYYGSIGLPENTLNTQGKRITVPFKNFERLKYFDLNAETMALTFQSYRPIDKINQTVIPKKIIIDFSNDQSPGSFDKDWKGCYISEYTLEQKTNIDRKGKRLEFTKDLLTEVSLTINPNLKNWFTALGLQYYSDQEFASNFGMKFNTFPVQPITYKIDVENSLVKSSEFRGRIKIPVIDDSRDFEVFAKITDDGFGEGFLGEDLANQHIYFSKEAAESKADLTVKRAVFDGDDHLDMTVDITVPYIKVKVNNIPNFKAYGDYQIGFGKRNGIVEFSEQVVGKYDQLFDLVFENFGAAYQNGRYVYYAATTVNLAQDAQATNGGPVKVNIYGTQKPSESLGIKNDYSSQPAVSIPATVTELPPAAVPLVDSINFKLDCGIAKLEGKVGIRKNDPEWGTCFNGKIKGVIYAPSEIGCGSTIIIGKTPSKLDYWFFDVFMYDKGTGVALVPGVVNIVGLEGRMFRHMSAKVDKSGKKAEIKIDANTLYGAGLYAQLIDAATNGQTLKADIGIEMKLLEGDFQLALKGQATILNLEGRTASSAVTQKASAAAAKEVATKAESVLNSQSFTVGDWTFRPNIKSAEYRGGLEAQNGTTKLGFGANVMSKSAYFNYDDSNWKIGLAGNKTPASFAFNFEKKTGADAFAIGLAYLPGDSMGLNFKQGNFGIGGAYYDTKKKVSFRMFYDDFKIGVSGSKQEKQYALFLQPNADIRISTNVDLIKSEGAFGLKFPGSDLAMSYINNEAKFRYNDNVELAFSKEKTKGSLGINVENVNLKIEGSPEAGLIYYKMPNFEIGANADKTKRSGGFFFKNSDYNIGFSADLNKRTGRLSFSDVGNFKFAAGTRESLGSGYFDLSWRDTDRMAIDFDMSKKSGSFLYNVDGNKFQTALNSDSALISTSINGVSLYASGHKSGRGGISYSGGGTEVKLFGDKVGKGNVLIKTNGVLFNVAADRTNGSGLVRYKLNNDTLYLMADRSKGIAEISSKFGDNVFQLGYNAEGRGRLKVITTENTIGLEGDKAGSGNILFSRPGFLVDAGANVPNKEGKLRLKINSDSIGAYFSAADGGRVNAAFGNNAFSGSANPDGKGNLSIKVGSTILSGEADPNGLNSIFFKDGDVYLSTGLNKPKQYGYFGFKKANDSLKADIDKLNKRYSFATAFSSNAFSGYYNDGKTGGLAINTSGVKLGVMADKAGIGLFDFVYEKNKARFYGDKTLGNAEVSVVIDGKDSLTTKVVEGKKYSGALSIGDFAMSYNYAPNEDKFYKYENGNTLLHGYSKLNGLNGGIFKDGSNKVFIEAQETGKGIVGVKIAKDSLLLGVNDEGKNYINASIGDNTLDGLYIKNGDKKLKFTNPSFSLEALNTTAEKMVDMKIGTDKRIRLSSTRYAYLNVNSHEFKMDATKPNQAYFYIDGREIDYKATDNQDSVSLGYKGDGANFLVAAHRAGRGHLSFDKGESKLYLFADKAGAGRISAKSGTTLFDIAGNKGTGNGSLRLLLGSDSLNIFADRSLGIARLGTKFGDNSMYANYNAEGYGNLSLRANGNYIALGGDASGSGNILFQNGSILAAASADVKASAGAIRFKMENDSINANFNGTAGNAGLTASFSGNAFSGSADKTGKGDVNFTTPDVQLNAALDPQGLNKVYFNKGELTFAAQNNKATKYSNIRFRLSNDSVSAFADKNANSYGFATSVSGTSLSARLENGANASMAFATGETKLSLRAAKAGNGAISYNDTDNSFYLEGDRATGNASFRLRPGADSLVGAIKDGKTVSGAFALSSNTMAFSYGQGQDNFFNFKTGDNSLNAFFNADNAKGAGFTNKDVKVRLFNQGSKGLASLKMGSDSVNAIINDNGNYSFASVYSGNSLITNYNKNADKNIKLSTSAFNITAGQFGDEKLVDFAFDNKKLKISSTKFVQLQANNHEFKMDARGAGNPKFFIDGSEVAYEFNKDSVNLGWSGDDKLFNVMAHRLGRGKVRFKLGDNDVSLFANKELGSAGVNLKTGNNLFQIEGNKTTGSGLMNIAIGNDSVYVMADRGAGLASIRTNVDGNSLRARYDATGKGFLNFAQGADNKIELSGDASGSGSIYLQKGANIIAANADINTKIGGFRLKSGSDSVNTSYNGSLGLASVATSISGASFSGNAYQSGKGNLDLSLSNLRLKASADQNLNSIYFKKDNFLLAASNDKAANKGNFRLKFENDSINAYVDGSSTAGFTTSVSNVALSGEIKEGIKGKLGVKVGTTQLYAAAEKQGSGTFSYADANNRFKIYGDKASGEGNLSLRFGSDSLQSSVAPNKYTGALSIGDLQLSYLHAPGQNSFYKFATNGVSLNGFMNPDNSKGVRFATAGNIVRLENAGSKGLVSFRKDADSLNIVVNDGGKHSFIGSLDKTYIETSYLKDGDKTLKFNTTGYGFATTYGSAEKAIDLTFDSKRINVSSKKFVLLQANNHEFKMDATNVSANPKFFIDGSEVQYEIGNKDSVGLGWSGGNDAFSVFAHRAGRGGLRFKKGDNDVSFYANKEGAGKISVATGNNAFLIAANKTTGYGAMRFKVGSDSINVLSDDASGVRKISTSYSGNSLFAGFENGVGTVGMNAAGTKINLRGDGSGNGNILFQTGDVLAAASSDMDLKLGTMRFKTGNDSINTRFNGSEGSANIAASFGGTAFRGAADKSGKGDLKLTSNGLNLIGQLDPAGINAISFRKDAFLFAASNDTKLQINSFRLRNGDDSLNAFVNKSTNVSSFATSVSGTSLGARLENGNNGVLTIATNDLKMDFASEKANSAKLNLVNGSTRVRAYGDKTSGDIDLALQMGSDSLTASSVSGNYKGAFVLGDKVMNFNAVSVADHNFNYKDASTQLSTYANPKEGKGVSFASGALLFKLENQTGDKGLFKLRSGADSLYSFINDNGKHTLSANYSGVSFNTEYKKDGDKYIKLQATDYLLEASEKATDKFINLKYKNHTVKVDNKRKASYNSGSHEFIMDAANAEIPKLFIDGKEFSFDASQLRNKDSISLGLNIDNYNVFASAHSAGRGQFRFKSSADELAIWGNKVGYNRIFVNTNGSLIDLGGNPTTGEGALRFKQNNDSINLQANPDLGSGSIAAAYGTNSFAGSYNGNGKGSVSLKTGDNIVSINGDASGSGAINLRQSDIRIVSAADINAKNANFSFSNTKDSLSTAFNGTEGKANVNAVFGDNSFVANANKTGLANLSLSASGINLAAGMNPLSGINFINYKQNDFAYKAFINKNDNLYNFAFKVKDDSLAATLDKQDGISSIKSFLAGNNISAFINSVGRASFTFDNPDFLFDLNGQKQGAGTIRYSGANGSGNFYGDVNNGLFNLKSRWGKDSMFVFAENNKPFTGGFAAASTGLAFQLNGAKGHYFTLMSNDASLDIIKGLADKDASLTYKNGDTKVRLLSTTSDKAEFAITMGKDSVSAKLNESAGTHSFVASILNNNLTTSFVKDGDKKMIFNGSGYSIENVYSVSSLKYAKFTRNGVGIKVSSDKKILVTTAAHQVLMQVASSNEPELYIDGVKQNLVPNVKFTIDGIDFMPKINMDLTMFDIDLPNFPSINVGFSPIGLPSFKCTLPNLPNVDLAFVHLPNGFNFDFDGRLFSFDVNMFKLNLPSFNYNLDFSTPNLDFAFKLPAVDFKWNGFGDFNIDFTSNLRFELTKDYAKALYFDKYLMLDKNLYAKLSYDNNKYVGYQINATAPKTLGKIDLKFDDLSGQFEKDKLLALKYQNASVNLQPTGAALAYNDKSIDYNVNAKTLTFKNGASNSITLAPKSVVTNWEGYTASLGADSLGFTKDDAVLNLSANAVKIAKGSKSIRADKASIAFNYDANTYANVAYDKVNAKWNDASITYSQGEPLSLAYQNNTFAINKTALKVANADKSLSYIFADKALSMKVASDSFSVSPERFAGVYKNYKLAFSKTAGMNFQDGSRTIAVSKEAIAATQGDVKLGYSIAANEISIQKGEKYSILGAPGKVGVVLDNTKIGFTSADGIKTLEVEIPGLRKITTGIDAQNLAYLNYISQVKELANGFSFTHEDKLISYSPDALKINLGKDIALNYADKKFDVAYTDFKAFYNSSSDFGASYKDANVKITPALKQLVYGDKSMSLNDKNDLNVIVSPTRTVAFGLAGTADVVFDDVKFNFERGKTLSVAYKKDYKFNVDEKGISTEYQNNSLAYEVGRALTLKQGRDNQVTITATNLVTNWAGYNFTVGKDSLGFNKDGAAVSVSEKGIKVAQDGKSLVYSSDKQLKLFYDANKFVEASTESFNAKWDDAVIAYGKTTPLKIAYKENSFVLNKTGLRLTDGARAIAYNFNQSASYRQGTDSFMVSKETVFAKYQNYNFSFDKTNGLSYNDGSRSALINGDRVAINIDDVAMSYNSAKTEVSFKKGSDNELTASPEGASLMMEGIKIAYMNDNGAKKLEFDVPNYAKINAGFDKVGGNFINFNKDNIAVAFTEKEGGYELSSGDKSIFASSKELRFNYSSKYNFKIAENNFSMNMGDMKAYYSGVANMGMEYQQAKFDVTADKAKLSVGDKYLQVDKNNNLRLQLQDTRYITANPLAMNVQFDDVTAIVEKDKQVSLKYKEENSLSLTEKGIQLTAGDRSLNFVVGESISVKDGENRLSIGKTGLSTNWSGYNFMLNEDSLSFAKDGAVVKASPTGARVAYDGKSLRYEQGKALELYLDANKHLTASPDLLNAAWDDASMTYGKDAPLKLVYQQNSFTLGKTALQLANGDNVLTYKFDQTISFRMKSDSFMVNKESIAAKYSNYNFALNKTKGLTYSDGSRSAEVSGSKIAINVEDVSMYYDATKTEVGFKKGGDNELTASPEGASLTMEGIKIAYFRDNGAHKLEFNVPNFAKIYGGYDAKGGNFFRFNKDNIDFAIAEKDGGYEFTTGDKLVAYTPNSISARYGKSAYLNLKGTEFDMQYNDLKANYSSPTKLGMSYGDAIFAINGDDAKLAYQNYSLALNTASQILKAKMSDNRYLEATAAGKVDFKYDDILASFEKDKQLAVSYKNEHKANITTTGAELISGDKSLVFEAGKSVTVKVGASNYATITPEKLTTTWSGYSFSVGKDSLGFDAEGAKVSVTATAALASYGGKSLVYESGKNLKFFYEATKFVEASPLACNAKWDDVNLSYAKNDALKVSYKENVFTLNKTALSLADGGGRVLKYKFDKTISVKVDADSFMVNENSLAAKYQKYTLSFSKTNGLSYNDGSRSLNANASKISLAVDDVSMYYDAVKTEIGFKRGSEQEVTASPTKSTIKMEGVAIAYFRNNGSHELEFDVPSFAKVSAGYDPNGKSMFSFAKDNVAFSVLEKNGGVEFKTMDKIAYISPTEFNFYYSNDMFMKFLENDFTMQIKDFKGYYKAKDNFGMIYNDAKFIVEPTFARLAYQDKYISLDDKKNLRVQYEPSKYLVASTTKLNFIYDDATFNFEKDKELAFNYKDDYKLSVNTSGIEASYTDKSIGVDFAKKTLLIKDGTTNSVAASEKGIAIDWASYKFMVSSDSLGFVKDGASVSAARSGLRVAYLEKSLAFATATKTFKVSYEANKYVTLSPEALGARWDDMGVDFSKNTSLSLYYKDKKFQLNKDYIALSEANARLAYKFAGELSVRYKNDSVQITKESIAGKFDKYSMSVSKAEGATLFDGSQTYKLKDKAEITYRGYTLSYDLNSKAIGLNKGTEWGLNGSATTFGFFYEDYKFDLDINKGATYKDKKNLVVLGKDLIVTSSQLTSLNFGIKNFAAANPDYYLNIEKYGISYNLENGYKVNIDNNWASMGGTKTLLAADWDDLKLDIQSNGRVSASKAGYGLMYGGDLYAGVIGAGSEITLTKTLKLGLMDKVNKKGVEIGSDGIVTLINGDQKIIAGGNQPIKFEDSKSGMTSPDDATSDEMKFNVAGMNFVVKPADGNNITMTTKVVGIDINLQTSGEGTMKAAVSKDGKLYGTIYKNFYSWGVAIGDSKADTDGPAVEEPVKMDGPANIGYITQNSTSVLQVLLYASYSSKTKTFILNGQATGSQPLLCTRNVTLAAKFSPDDWYVKVADKPREKWASVKPLCLFVETQGYFYIDKNVIEAGLNYGYHFDISTGWVTIIPKVFEAKVGAYFDFNIGGEGKIQLKPKFAIPYIRIWLDARAGIYGCVNIFGGGGGCVTLIEVRIAGELALVITDAEKSASGKISAGVTICGKSFDAEFSTKVNF